MLKIILLVVGGIVIVASGMAIWAYSDVVKYKDISIGEIDLSEMPNGEYKGTFNGGRFTNSVEVIVIDNRIENIKLIDSEGKAENLYNQIYDEVKKKQSLKVDTVSGATITTKTALKAIENALSKKG
jgi:uncharacterized protein with FMN-binding domain